MAPDSPRSVFVNIDSVLCSTTSVSLIDHFSHLALSGQLGSLQKLQRPVGFLGELWILICSFWTSSFYLLSFQKALDLLMNPSLLIVSLTFTHSLLSNLVALFIRKSLSIRFFALVSLLSPSCLDLLAAGGPDCVMHLGNRRGSYYSFLFPYYKKKDKNTETMRTLFIFRVI